ncbi:methyltransferase type 12 [Lasiosphaeria ovina]|uniref:Methyltransferase type 12 n=1 Tax=Lasiosphaeria ovina TaxID=92902 RepID=A0AAE0KH71_9PEZI|nr:methyltransferase type 12 [Lasiosphaeria ovina]
MAVPETQDGIPAANTPPEPPVLSAEEVFDAVGPAYEDAFADMPEQDASIKWLVSQLSAVGRTPARVVDIGCGTGRPVCSSLAAAGHDVLGIDISGAMVAAARARVPAARFEKADVHAFEAAPGSYDAATAYFSLIAGETQNSIRLVLSKVYDLLRPGGLFVWATVPLPADSLRISWMGHPVRVSSLPPDDAVAAVEAAGFNVLRHVQTVFRPKAAEAGICKPEDVWDEPHLYIYASKPV